MMTAVPQISLSCQAMQGLCKRASASPTSSPRAQPEGTGNTILSLTTDIKHVEL